VANEDFFQGFAGQGEQQAAAKAQSKNIKAQTKSAQKIAKLQASTQKKVAKMQIQAQKDLAEANYHYTQALQDDTQSYNHPFDEAKMTGFYQGPQGNWVQTLEGKQQDENKREFDTNFGLEQSKFGLESDIQHGRLDLDTEIQRGQLDLQRLNEQHDYAIATGNLDLARTTQEQKNTLETRIQAWTEASQRMQMSGFMDNGQMTEEARQNRAQEAINTGNLTGVYVDPTTGARMTTEQAREFAANHGLDVTKVMGVDESGRMTDAAQQWRTQAALDYAKTAAQLQANPGDYFESAAFQRGAQASGVPAFLQEINQNGMGPNMGFRSAQTGLPSVGSMAQVAAGPAGSPGATGPGPAPINYGHDVYLPNGAVLNPGQIQQQYAAIAAMYGPGEQGVMRWMQDAKNVANDPTQSAEQRNAAQTALFVNQQAIDRYDGTSGTYRDPDYESRRAAGTAMTYPGGGPAFGAPAVITDAMPITVDDRGHMPPDVSPAPPPTGGMSTSPVPNPVDAGHDMWAPELAPGGIGVGTSTPVQTKEQLLKSQFPDPNSKVAASPPDPTEVALGQEPSMPNALQPYVEGPSDSITQAHAADNGAQVAYTSSMNQPMPPQPTIAQTTGQAGGMQANPGLGARFTATGQMAQPMMGYNMPTQTPSTFGTPAFMQQAITGPVQTGVTQYAQPTWNPNMGARAQRDIPINYTPGMDVAQQRLAAFAPTFLRGAHKLQPGAYESMSPTEKALFGSAARASGIRPEDFESSYKRSRLQTDMSPLRV
jgi:hypothetical protein